MKNKLSDWNYNKHILTYLIIFMLCCAVQNINADNSSQLVRVGYYENEVFQEGASKGTVKTGYAYEYYRKISEYTGWKYQYIYGSYGDLYKMLLDGQIDLLAGLAWKKDREGLIGYPQAAMGNETFSLVKHDTDTDITKSLDTLNGKTIGVLDSAMVDVLAKFLLSHNIKASIITFQAYNELFEAFDSNKINILAAEGDGAYRRDHAEVLCAFGASEYYLCVNINRPDLLRELDTAQAMLAVEEPNYLNSLRMKYYPVSMSSRAFSETERKWLAAHKTINIGYLNRYLPYCDTDKSGHLTGILNELMPTMMHQLGISNIKIKYIACDSYSTMIEKMSNSEIDAIFPVGGGLYYSEENGINQSNPVSSMPPIFIYNSKTNKNLQLNTNAKLNFAVNENNSMQYYYVRTNFPNSNITFYRSIEECFDAILNGDVDGATVNGLRNEILKNRKYRHLSMQQLTEDDDRCFGVEIGNEGLLKILNRGLNIIGAEYAHNLSYKYTSALFSYSLWDMICDHMSIFVVLVIILAAIIILLILRDAKQSKAALNAAEHANKAKTVFLNNMSHDIRTPMNAIVGFTTLAQGSIDDKDKLNEYLSKIAVSSQHMLSLINDVLDMSRIESGKVTIDESKVCLPDLIRDIQTIIQANLSAKHHNLTVKVDITHEYIMTDKLRLNQILLNILSNSIKFTPDGGEIGLSIKESSADSTYSVFTFNISDNGIGMSQEFRSVIFEAFTREKSTTVSGIQGTGLGMAITKKIVDMMGGSIEVNSCEGNGSEFIVTIPCKICEVPIESAEQADTEVDFSGKRVAGRRCRY